MIWYVHAIVGTGIALFFLVYSLLEIIQAFVQPRNPLWVGVKKMLLILGLPALYTHLITVSIAAIISNIRMTPEIQQHIFLAFVALFAYTVIGLFYILDAIGPGLMINKLVKAKHNRLFWRKFLQFQQRCTVGRLMPTLACIGMVAFLLLLEFHH